MANSSCAPNLTSVMRRDGSLALVASRDIATGEEMTVCYTGTRWGRSARQRHLQLTKYFQCTCARCRDGAELGTHVSSLRCTVGGCGGAAWPRDTCGGTWTCARCDQCMDSKQVMTIEAAAGQMLKLPRNNPKILEKAVKRLEPLLWPSHYVLLELNIALIFLYLDSKHRRPERVAALCGAVLPVLETIEGYSKSVALLHIAEVEALICMRDKQEDKETLRNLKSKFLKAFHLVKEDVEAPENLNSLQQHLFEMK